MSDIATDDLLYFLLLEVLDRPNLFPKRDAAGCAMVIDRFFLFRAERASSGRRCDLSAAAAGIVLMGKKGACCTLSS